MAQIDNIFKQHVSLPVGNPTSHLQVFFGKLLFCNLNFTKNLKSLFFVLKLLKVYILFLNY